MAQHSHAPSMDPADDARDDDAENAQGDFGWDRVPVPDSPGVSPRQSEAGAAPAGLDLHGQQARLKEAYPARDWQAPPGASPATGVASAKTTTAQGRRVLPRVFKTALGCLIVALVGYVPVHRFVQRASTEAIVSTRVITIRAPIDGEIGHLTNPPEVGTPVKAGAPLLSITNRRADRGRLDDLRRLIDLLESERSALAGRLELLRSQRTGLVEQTHAFQRGRVRQLEERIAEIESEIKAAVAPRAEAGAALLRTSILADRGVQSQAAHDRAERDDVVAEQTETALRRRLAGAQVELEAARQGMFVGDSYNDRPSSSQHADEVVLRIGELQAELRTRDERLAHLRTELGAEVERYSDQSIVELTAPVSGSVWEKLTAPGEEVRRGQDLLRLLDCSGVVVNAAVNEWVYEKLHVGDPARFRLQGETTDYPGQVVRLSGLAAPTDNWALGSSALGKDLFRVTVSISGINEPTCAVGRPGTVAFEPMAAPDADRSIGSRLLGLLRWR
jgi:multidrug resistance efflux pump